ncbi:unnamed protein product [Larinioides sclopetarius]|uniref:EF-hand domain-containing protein n=1 Tax=Larinioides sclopetarius TaxID=280406 RepID=A0AAV2ANX3_9ARAC
MISCFKVTGGASGIWENGVNNTHAAVYTSASNFDSDYVPKISKIIESLREYDVFRYSAYRTAFKLRAIQKASKCGHYLPRKPGNQELACITLPFEITLD